MEENKVSKILFFIGVIVMIVGFILGIVNGATSGNIGEGFYYEEDYETFLFLPFFLTALYGFIVGMIFIGFSEVIKLLHLIYLNLNATETVTSVDKTKNVNAKSDDSEWKITKNDREKIHQLFSKGVHKIIPTPFDSLCVVILDNEIASVVKIVDVGGFNAEEVNDKEIIEQVMAWYQRYHS